MDCPHRRACSGHGRQRRRRQPDRASERAPAPVRALRPPLFPIKQARRRRRKKERTSASVALGGGGEREIARVRSGSGWRWRPPRRSWRRRRAENRLWNRARQRRESGYTTHRQCNALISMLIGKLCLVAAIITRSGMPTPEELITEWLGDEIREGVASFVPSSDRWYVTVTLCPTRMIAAGLVLCAAMLAPRR